MTAAKLLVLLVTTFSLSAIAGSPLLTCSTNGFGLAKLTVEETRPGQGDIKIVYEEIDEGENVPVYSYSIVSGLKDLKTSSSATLVAQYGEHPDDGKIYDQAILLRIAEGQKRAFLAVKGTVFKLLCF